MAEVIRARTSDIWPADAPELRAQGIEAVQGMQSADGQCVMLGFFHLQDLRQYVEHALQVEMAVLTRARALEGPKPVDGDAA